jgi:hypothetical protein
MVSAMQQQSYDAFREAVLDLLTEPTPLNAKRYLAASRKLERGASTTTAAPNPARTRTPRPASTRRSGRAHISGTR